MIEDTRDQRGGRGQIAALSQGGATAEIAIADGEDRLDLVLAGEVETFLHQPPLGIGGGRERAQGTCHRRSVLVHARFLHGAGSDGCGRVTHPI